MNVQSPKTRIAHSILALSICALVPLPSLATDFLDPPGSYDYYHWYAAGNNVPTGVTRPNYTTNTQAIKLGEDYYISGKLLERKWASTLPTTAFGYRANNRYGVLVYKAGTPVLGCSNSCTISVSASDERCQSIQLQWGIDASTSLPDVADVTMNFSASVSQQACLASTTGWDFNTGYRSSSTYIQAVTGIEYKYARVATSTKKIVFRSSIVEAATTNEKLIAAHRLCLSQGWASNNASRTDISFFKQTIKYTGNACNVPNSTLQHYVYGPHPAGGVYTESYATKRVYAGDFITVYEDAEDIE